MNLTEQQTKAKLESVEWSKVVAEITPWNLPEYDTDRVFDLVLHAAKTWVPEDFAEGCSVGAVEELRVDGLFKGFADVTVVRAPEYMKIIDWKTTGAVDAAWKTEHAKGWQALWYGVLWWEQAQTAGLPLIVEFRGIERGSGRTRVVPVSITSNSIAEVNTIMETVMALRFGGIKASGDACYAYGKPCEFLKTRCDAANDANREEFYAIETAPISPTSAKRIFTCPRKNFLYQLDKLRGKDDTGGGKFTPGVNEKAVFGNAFHSGIGEVYNQLSKNK